MAGKITPSELKFTFQMKDEFDGVNPKHLVKRETQQGYNSGGGSYIGTCSHYWFVLSKQFSFLSPHFKFPKKWVLSVVAYVVICMSSCDLLSGQNFKF